MKITNQISAKRRSKSRRSSSVKHHSITLPKSTSTKKKSNAGKIAGITLGSVAAGSLATFGVIKGVQAAKDKYNNTITDLESKSEKLVNAAKVEANNKLDNAKTELQGKISELETKLAAAKQKESGDNSANTNEVEPQ